MTARKSGAAKPPALQDRPAAPAKQKDPEPVFPPNPVAAVKAGPEKPEARTYRVTGPKAVGGVSAPGTVELSLTAGQAAALQEGGHVEPYDPDAEESATDDAVTDSKDDDSGGGDG